MKHLLLLGLLAGVVACSPTATKKANSMKDLVFLTRDGCMNTPLMGERLDAALASLGLPKAYQVINSDKLPTSDARGGYPTPTVLIANTDLFGMAEPPTPHDAAT